MQIKNKFLFNFAVSHSGGGLKRLYAYSRWFNENGGAYFIISPCCRNLINEFQNNRFFLVDQPRFQRIFNDCKYLDAIVEQEIELPDLYYSYGIPVYARVGKINWFHLSNVLPLLSRNIPLSLFDRLKLGYLGFRIKQNLKYVEVISAESNYSLGLLGGNYAQKFCLSVNGSDDEIEASKKSSDPKNISAVNNVAVAVGTHRYKCIEDVYKIYCYLRESNPEISLIIVGIKEKIPSYIRRDERVVMAGLLSQAQVCELLKSSKYYITSTIIENSYNAASEGAYLAKEAFISDIGPHRELLKGMKFEIIGDLDTRVAHFHVHRANLSVSHLKSWNQVIVEMNILVEDKLLQGHSAT